MDHASRTRTTGEAMTRRAEALVVDVTAVPTAGAGAQEVASRVRALLEAGMEVVVLARSTDGDARNWSAGSLLGGCPGLVVATDAGAYRLTARGPVTLPTAWPDGVGGKLGVALAYLGTRGIGPGLVGIVLTGSRPLGLPGAERAQLVAVPTTGELARLLDEQLALRERAVVPFVDEDPEWIVVLEEPSLGFDQQRHRVFASLTTLADGQFGTRGAREDDTISEVLVVAAGVFDDEGESPQLLQGPIWTQLVGRADPNALDRRVLDLRTGVLQLERLHEALRLRTFRFSSIARPGAFGLRAEGPTSAVREGRTLFLPPRTPHAVLHREDSRVWGWTKGRMPSSGGIAAAATTSHRVTRGTRTIERLAAYVADPATPPGRAEAMELLDEVEALGFDRLLAEQRAAWAQRWQDAGVEIGGDPELQLAARFALFHLMATTSSEGEAGVGARGLSGETYGGHVLWDADVYVLPALAATHPASARAMLEYRLRRVGTARRIAADGGLAGLRFPWESGHAGTDITPHLVRHSGQIIPIRTGIHEEHVIADVAWAASHYVEWTGDEEFLEGPGRALVVDAARYWHSRVRFDAEGAAHIFGVVGPDEYHEIVDDNAFTNVMARWNLRRAAELVEHGRPRPSTRDLDEASAWRFVADALKDGYDEASGRYEQAAGFWRLPDRRTLRELDLTPPLMADEELVRRRTRDRRWPFVLETQILKQPDVLMLHHLVPDEVVPGSLGPNLDYYLPRTAHGSSLSPAICASLLARDGRLDEALDLFRLAARLDLDDLTGTTSGGLHLATMGGVWQALLAGFAGVRPSGRTLEVDPRLPAAWDHLRLRFRFRDARVRVTIRPDTVQLETDTDLTVRLPGAPPFTIAPPGTTRAWEPAPASSSTAR